MSPPADAGFAPLKALLIRRTGHHYYADKDDLLWERVQRRLQVLGLPGCGAYLQRLADPASGEAEWAALEAEVTIGETFFFRYAEQFAALRATILPELLERHRHSRRLRLWSAGCANGAEPYSIAILLRQLLGEALGAWDITLLGTDLSRVALAQARAATFSAWSLRTVPPEERARDFLPAPGGQGWQLQPRHQRMVRFQHHNLMQLLAPEEAPGAVPAEEAAEKATQKATEARAMGLRGFDLILCRNVLIYFDPDVVPAVVRGLAGRLAPGGWLLLGHAEPNPAFSDFLHPVLLPGTAAWRQKDTPTEAGVAALAPLPAGLAAAGAAGSAGAGATGSVRAGAAGSMMAGAGGLTRVGAPAPAPAAPAPAGAASGGTASGGAATAQPPPRAWAPLPVPSSVPAAPPAALDPARGGTAGGGGAPGPAAMGTSPPATAAGAALQRARRQADLGDLEGASTACREGLAAEPDHAPLHFYEAMVAGTRGQTQAAAHAFRRTIALRQGFAMAHYQLGLLLLGAGQAQPGRQALAAAARIAHGLPGETMLEEGDGMTAHDLREAARLQLDAPGGA